MRHNSRLSLPSNPFLTLNLDPRPYLEGHGDLVSRLLIGISGAIIWLIGVINLLSESLTLNPESQP